MKNLYDPMFFTKLCNSFSPDFSRTMNRGSGGAFANLPEEMPALPPKGRAWH